MTDDLLVEEPVVEKPKKSLMITQVMDGRPCWERLTGERAKSFAAFAHYRDQGPTRTMRDTIKMLISELNASFERQEQEADVAAGKGPRPKHKISRTKKETTAMVTLTAWATAYAWQERAEFFDRHIDRIRIEQMERDTREMSTRHISFATILMTRAREKLESVEGKNLTASEALKMGVEGVKIERLTRVREASGIEEPETPSETRSSAREELKKRIDAIAEKKRQESVRAAQAMEEKNKEPQITAKDQPSVPMQDARPDLKLVQSR